MSTTHVSAALRREVHDRASGCCEYCRVPESFDLFSFQIDHIYAEKHGGLTVSENLALACVECNQWKGTDLASIDPTDSTIVRLYHPREDSWRDHFCWREVLIEPLTNVGRVTGRLLRFNTPARIQERLRLVKAGELRVSD